MIKKVWLKRNSVPIEYVISSMVSVTSSELS